MDISKVLIALDSSADTRSLEGVGFASVPLKIITSQKEYVDDETLDTRAMIKELAAYSGKSGTSCPAPDDWIKAFGEYEYIFCVTITGTLSGSNNSANLAKREYEEVHPDRKVFVLDSLSAGPELMLIAERIRKLVLDGKSFEDVCAETEEYAKSTALIFMLESMRNLANNGRVSPIVAKIAGLLGIRVVGKASAKGDLEPLEKSRGSIKAIASIVSQMKKCGYRGGAVRIGNVENVSGAENLKQMLLKEFPEADITVYPSMGLCCFYAEKGGLMIGFEHG